MFSDGGDVVERCWVRMFGGQSVVRHDDRRAGFDGEGRNDGEVLKWAALDETAAETEQYLAGRIGVWPCDPHVSDACDGDLGGCNRVFEECAFDGWAVRGEGRCACVLE